MTDRIDLNPLMVHGEAAEMVLLARGQLNRAFRKHGLSPPDTLPLSDAFGIDQIELDDPAASGIAKARPRFGEVFDVWASEMPAELVNPVLGILRQALEALTAGPDNANAVGAVSKAYDLLLECSQSGRPWNGSTIRVNALLHAARRPGWAGAGTGQWKGGARMMTGAC
jgi:hypothetical protein